MAAAELSRAASAPGRSPARWAAAFLATYAALWGCTLAAAAPVAAGAGAGRVRSILALTLTPARNPPPTLARILALAAHNLPIAAWPLLLGVAGTASSPLARRAADSLVVGCALANTLPVGAALGAYGARLVPYIPQLPLEWAALAAGYCSWIHQRREPLNATQRFTWLALTTALVIGAAVIERAAVPHR